MRSLRLLAFVVSILIPLESFAFEIERNFAGSAQLDHLTIPTAEAARELSFDGFTTEIALKLAVDFSENLSANVKVCYGCHGFETDMAYVDLRVVDELNFRLGRINASFGDFPLRHDPANHRTNSKPLPYDMGRMIHLRDWNMSVLPAPHSDNGLEVNGTHWFGDDVQLDYAAYIVSGFKGANDGLDLDFILSRSGSTYYVDNTTLNSQNVVFGGFTTVLTAEMAVICGETYHLRMMISDGGDSSYDTGCFVAENSLTTGSVIVETATAAADSTAYEGCNDATVTLTLNGPPLAQDFPVPIWISGATAEPVIDYDPILELNPADSTITIPAGQNTVTFTISPVNDNIAEGSEFIEFIVITSTCGLTDTFRIYINDLEPIITTTSNDTTICTGNAIAWCEAVGGGGMYTYTWDNGIGVEDTITPTPTQTTLYNVTVTDNCNSTPVIDSVTVTVDNGPTPNAGNDVFVSL